MIKTFLETLEKDVSKVFDLVHSDDYEKKIIGASKALFETWKNDCATGGCTTTVSLQTKHFTP